MCRINSFVASVEAREGLLLGGVKRHESARFQEFSQAVAWIDAIIKGNKDAGREPISGGIRPTCLDPEIMAEDA